MPAVTVRIPPRAHRTLRLLAKKSHESMGKVVEQALETYRREKFWKACNEAYARLKSDPKAWAEELEERKTWETTLTDGLDPY